MRIIHTSNEISEKNWSRFVFESKYGNIFQTPEMYRVFLDTDYYEPVFTALLDENGEIMATMLGALIEEPGRITRRFSRRIIVYGGPIISERGNRGYLLEKILRAHNDYAEKRAIFTEIRNLAPRGELRPRFESVGYKYIDHLNILIDLNSGIDGLWNNLHKKRRTGIRKALKNELRSEVITLSDLEDVYTIVNDTYRRARIPAPPKSLIESVVSVLQSEGMARVIGIKYQNELIAVIMTLIYNDVIYDWYAAGNIKYSNPCANEYAVWVALEWAIKNGFRRFDF